MHRLGLDLGSSYTKGVLVNSSLDVADRLVVKTGYDFTAASMQIIEYFSKKHEIAYPVYSCGYGREKISVPYVANSELIALAKAVFSKYGNGTTVLDIGGQDTKFLEISDDGKVKSFKLNRKCAAGTGSFLEEIAFRLGVEPEEFDGFARKATAEVKINSFCTVFAITEIIGMIKSGVSLPNIVRGIYNCIVDRAMELAPLGDCVVLAGGVPARHPVVVDMFKSRIGSAISPEDAQFMAAFGCVLLNS